MLVRSWLATTACLVALSPSTSGQCIKYNNATTSTLLRTPFSIYGDRPDNCPPCFNCNLEDFKCQQFANCSKASGRCACPSGFGGEDCSQPLCGSLADGNNRLPRGEEHECQCKEGWEGINCNVCKTNDACNALMPEGEGGVCFREGLVVKENYQMCDVTNKKILDQLKEQKPQVTFSCNADREECNFQFWVDQKESFYCALDHCAWSAEATDTRNSTHYRCDNIKCRCIPGRMLCGEEGSIDIGEFLEEDIKGPASFSTTSEEGTGSTSKFDEPAMNQLISDVFGDPTITLSCGSGECLYKTDVPGYERPVKKINTPLIAGVIAGCGIFIVVVILLVYFLSRRSSQRLGPIHLSDDEDEDNAALMANHKPASLSFEKVSYNLKGKQILYDISGRVHPGQLMAIMGASGAGKTTFLDILARKNKRGVANGSFYVNGQKIPDDDFRSVIGFVDQDDTMLPTLTVHETIMDSALLRLPRDMSIIAKEQKVEDVERQLGIYHIRDQLIGSEEGSGRGISGGEKRRVGIACELVTSPSILFLDEPTSGLDAYNAFNVVECLVNLVKTYNRTVIFTIHQPRSNIVALFDQLVLLAKGRTVYSGPFQTCQSYFDSIGYACPPGFNIADYLVDLTMHASASRYSDDSNGNLFSPRGDGDTTRASSAIAVKSILSTNNDSFDGPASPPSNTTRPGANRKASVRQQQERQLFSRKKTQGPGTPQTTASSNIGDRDNDGQWLKLSRKLNFTSSGPVEDRDNIPPAAPGATGTNLDGLVAAFKESEVFASLTEDIHTAVSNGSETPNGVNGNGVLQHSISNPVVKGYRKTGLIGQFIILSRRTWRNLYRNPMLMLTHYAIAILLAVLIGWLFYGLTDDMAGFQNRLGFFFFLLALFGFSTLSSLTVFAPERLLFVRERAKGYYAPISYYAAKVIFDIVPLRLIPPILMGAIVYPMTGLIPAWPEFAKFMLFIVLFNLAAATMCLFIGIMIRNGGVANLLGVLVMLFSLLFSGFLLNHHTIPKAVLWLQTLSIFHYGFEGLLVNEVYPLSLIDHKYGLDIEVPGSTILSTFGFNNLALWSDAIGLAVWCGIFLVLGYAAMHFVLVERR
ncbi:hypothetical protein KVT40_006847 [Elsinoe batatas]|uniref:ABC transporter domain-containing protein n=1 Tax=Elsinoe batatas TaxID=2601811 RepID=A0A8K0PCY6_9PEZI|nr:hypothetical protein KVT40_006847 [Elsinoe batatas]